ncbi:MAG: pyridoxal-phosphate dependent enzyme, partial [Proteobacteria bacterium]|nr:pyridoxal-phosphate dependent enzyme [Pseudomonadota bacterium]
GAVQSNFARLAAAAARKLGMECHIQHEERVPKTDAAYRCSGNVLLEKMLGATLHAYSKGEDEAGADGRLGEIAAELEAAGRRPYIIHLAPGHPPLGALGYVAAARELVGQMAEQDLIFDEIVVASGSGHTHGGLLFGLRALGCMIPVTGICVRRDAEAQERRITKRCREIADLLELEPLVGDGDIRLDDRFLAPGYGRLNDPTVEAIEMAARFEALILDPVYTGKAMAGFLQRARDDAGGDKAFLFIHTGGSPAVFGYGPTLTQAMIHE